MQFSASIFLAPYLHKLSAVVQIMNFFWCYLGQISIKFGANSALNFLEITAETAPSNGAIYLGRI